MARKPKQEPAHVIHDSCCNCMYWRRLDDSDQLPDADVIGECRRYPPAVFGLDHMDEPIQALPEVKARFYCGEHHRAIN
ncbi:MAG: hypothetical protein WC710_14800 [Gallionella sp.]|jgi:hypothetical protein